MLMVRHDEVIGSRNKRLQITSDMNGSDERGSKEFPCREVRIANGVGRFQDERRLRLGSEAVYTGVRFVTVWQQSYTLRLRASQAESSLGVVTFI